MSKKTRKKSPNTSSGKPSPRSIGQVGENPAVETPPGGSEQIKQQGRQAIPQRFSKSIA